MKSLPALIVLTIALPASASSYQCESTGVIQVVNARLDASVGKDVQTHLPTTVWLYSDHNLIAKTRTDREGHFVFDRLVSGRYQLVIDRFGRFDRLPSFDIFDLEVKSSVAQQPYYGFYRTNEGCPSWVMNMN